MRGKKSHNKWKPLKYIFRVDGVYPFPLKPKTIVYRRFMHWTFLDKNKTALLPYIRAYASQRLRGMWLSGLGGIVCGAVRHQILIKMYRASVTISMHFLAEPPHVQQANRVRIAHVCVCAYFALDFE